jgi:hypothetical protein
MEALTTTVLLCVLGLMSLASTVNAAVVVNGLFSDHMVLQRDMPCPVWGTATANKTITGKYSISAIAGTWHVSASATGYLPSAAKSVTVKSAPIPDTHIALAASGRDVPRTADLLFSVVTDSPPDSGQVFVFCNGFRNNSEKTIPDGQITVLSLVVQPDAKYKVHASATEIMDNANRTSDMTSLNPNFNGGRAREITLGGGTGGWSTFNGNIGDLFVYKVALTDAKRQQLEASIKRKVTGERK